MYLTSSLLIDIWVFSNFASTNNIHTFSVQLGNFMELLLLDQKDCAFANLITTAKLPTTGVVPIYAPISAV